MKKIRRYLSIGTFVALLFAGIAVAAVFDDTSTLAAVISANKSKSVADFSFKDIQNITGNVTEVNAANNYLMVTTGNKKKKVLTQDAVFVQITPTTTKTVTLADIVVKKDIQIYAKKTLGPKKEYVALLVTQAVSQVTPSATVQFTGTGVSNPENVATPIIGINLSEIQKKDVKVTYTVSGTAVGNGTDYIMGNGELTIAAGSATAQIPIAIVDDTSTESNETIIITLNSATNVNLGTQKVFTYTITDNDSAKVQFSSSSSSGSEGTTTVSLPISLSQASTEQILVDYTVSGTATGSGTDFTLANGTATIPANQTNVTLAFTVVDDALTESDETVVVTLSNPRGASLGTNTVYTYTIQDNDQPRVNVSAATSSALESAGSVNIGVTLSAASPSAVVTSYTVSGTATGGGTDYTLANGTVTIAAGQTTANIAVPLIDDGLDELDETVIVTLTSTTNATLGSTLIHTLTIQDNDVPVAQFSSASGNGGENTTPVNVAVALSLAPAAQVQLTYTVTGTATGAGVDYTLANGTVTIAAGQTTANIPLAIVDDAIVDPGETVIITLSSPTNASLGATNVYTYTINDND